MRKLVYGVLLAALATSLVCCRASANSSAPPEPPAVDASGRWTITLDRDLRGNPNVRIECTFNQQRSELTVKCGDGIEMTGAVHGHTATWGFAKTGVPGSPTERLVLAHSADIAESGTSLKGHWRLTSSVLDENGTFEGGKRQ